MTTTLSTAYDLDLETVSLVWLDASANTTPENIATQKQFQSIIHHFKIFQTVHDCEHYIREKSKDDRLFFVVSGQLGREIVPRIHHYRQIFAIYVYCQNKQLNEEWANKFSKVKGVIIKLDLLIQQIQSDYTKRLQTKLDESFPINISVNEDFLHSQIVIDCLLQMKTIPTDKSELINLCKNEYHNDPNELARIQEFQQTYVSNQALWWYTRDSFLHRILNKAFCTKNLDLLYPLGFFIRDIHDNLQKNRCKSSMQVYIGQLMSSDEFQLFKIGESITVNKFLSAYYNRKQILTRLKEYPVSNDYLRILFEIEADPEMNKSKPFSDITPFVYLTQEQQVLFTLGSIFRIMDISPDKKNGLWIIKLALATIRKDYDSNDLIACVHLLQQMKKYDHAEKFLLRRLKEIPVDHPDIPQYFHSLALISFLRDHYNLSLQWYQKLIKIFKSNDPNLSETFYSLGCVYQKLFDHQQALQYYQKALDIWTAEINGNHKTLRMAECLNNMGCINELEGFYSKAMECHQQALAIRGQYQIDLGSSYNNIANVYLCLGEYSAALENYNYAFEVKSKSLSMQDPSLATTLRNIGLVYEEDGNMEEALKYYKRAALMFEQIYPSMHVYNIEIQEDIQRMSSQEKRDRFESNV